MESIPAIMAEETADFEHGNKSIADQDSALCKIRDKDSEMVRSSTKTLNTLVNKEDELLQHYTSQNDALVADAKAFFERVRRFLTKWFEVKFQVETIQILNLLLSQISKKQETIIFFIRVHCFHEYNSLSPISPFNH